MSQCECIDDICHGEGWEHERCTGQAKYRVELTSGPELLCCACTEYAKGCMPAPNITPLGGQQ